MKMATKSGSPHLRSGHIYVRLKMNDEILKIIPPKLPTRIKFNNRGRIVSLILTEIRMMRMMRKIAGVNPDLL
jgi:hypothetical protein